EIKPNLTMDDGADLVSVLHSDRQELLEHVLGGTEEATAGVIRLRAMAKEGVLKYPIVAVNDAMTKHLFDNRYGTGQSTLDGIIRATNRLIAGSIFVVSGYGWCGRGIPMPAQGLGAGGGGTAISPPPAPGGGDGWIARDADGRSGEDRRLLLHRDRRRARDPQGALRKDERRSDRLQQRPLQRRVGSRGAELDGQGKDADPRLRRAVHAQER